MFPESIIRKIFETNSSFHEKQRSTGKTKLLFFEELLGSIHTIFILAERLGTGLSFYEV